MTVSISEEMGEFIRQCLSEGRYQTPEGIVEDALHLLREWIVCGRKREEGRGLCGAVATSVGFRTTGEPAGGGHLT
jgi:Arc/MetJ-type ribon-helix-helix transcriptional regulator